MQPDDLQISRLLAQGDDVVPIPGSTRRTRLEENARAVDVLMTPADLVELDKAAPVGFREIRLKFDLDTDAAEEQRKKLVELTERYCVVLQTLRAAPPVAVECAAL